MNKTILADEVGGVVSGCQLYEVTKKEWDARHPGVTGFHSGDDPLAVVAGVETAKPYLGVLLREVYRCSGCGIEEPRIIATAPEGTKVVDNLIPPIGWMVGVVVTGEGDRGDRSSLAVGGGFKMEAVACCPKCRLHP